MEVGSGTFIIGVDIRGRSHGRSIMSEYMKRRSSAILCLIQNDFYRRWGFRSYLEEKKKGQFVEKRVKENDCAGEMAQKTKGGGQ